MLQNAMNLLLLCSPYLTALAGYRLPGGGRRRPLPAPEGQRPPLAG